jgi:hypothetical protein
MGITRSDAIGGVSATVLLVAAATPITAVVDGPVLCPFRAATGLPCPLCGMTRSFVHTMHGDVFGAIAFHPGGPVLVIAFFALVGFALATRVRLFRTPLISGELLRDLTKLGLGLVVVFGLVRLGVDVAS